MKGANNMGKFNYKVENLDGVIKRIVTFFACRGNIEKIEEILKIMFCSYVVGGDYFEPIVQINVDNRSEYLYIRRQLELLNLV